MRQLAFGDDWLLRKAANGQSLPLLPAGIIMSAYELF
jgi:hypothetical protein